MLRDPMKYGGEELFLVEGPSDFDILYVPLRGYVAKVVKGVNPLEDEEFMEGLLAHLKTKDYYDIDKAIDEMHRTLPALSIPITDDCNLRCRYCYASAGDSGHSNTFTEDMIEAILDAYFGFIREHGSEYINVLGKSVSITIAGGGEPTIRPKLFRQTIEGAKRRAAELGLTCEFGMPTNLTCSREMMEYIIENFTYLSVSIDGPKWIQDAQRPYRNGTGSFDTVTENLKLLAKSDVKYGFRVTVTRESVEHLREIVDFFNDNYPGRSISLEKMHLMGRVTVEDDYPDELFNERFQELVKYAEANGIRVMNSIMRKFDSIRPAFCRSVGIPNWTVTIGGDIVSCTRDNMPEIFTFGHFDFENKRFVIDEEKLRRIRALTVDHYPECEDCFCKYTCAGDCPDLRFISKPNCELTRELGAKELKVLLDESE